MEGHSNYHTKWSWNDWHSQVQRVNNISVLWALRFDWLAHTKVFIRTLLVLCSPAPSTLSYRAQSPRHAASSASPKPQVALPVLPIEPIAMGILLTPIGCLWRISLRKEMRKMGGVRYTEGVNQLYILLITSLHVYLLRTSWTPSFEFLIEASLCRYDRFNYWPLTNQLNHHPFPCLKIEVGTEILSCSDCQLPIGPCLRCCFPVGGGVCYGAVETLGPR